MTRKTAAVFLFLSLTMFIAAGLLWAEKDSTDPKDEAKAEAEPKHVFKINGKPVPEFIAVVNGVKLPAQYLENQLITFKIFKRQRGEHMTPEEEAKLVKDTMKNLVDLELLSQKSEEMNIKADPKAVSEQISKISGQFPSRELFLNALAIQRLTMIMLKESIEKRLLEQEFLRREVVPKVDVDDASVKKYYLENPAMFRQPERIAIHHIFIRAPHTDDAGKASDPALQKKADRLMALIDKDALDLIQKTLIKLEKGGDFAKLAKKYSEDDASKVKGGLIGTITSEQTLPEIFQAASKLKAGKFSGIVKSSYGYHIVKVTEKFPAKTADLSDVKSDILNVLMKIAVQKKKEAILLEMRKSADIKLLL